MITESLCFLGQNLPQGKIDQVHCFVMPGAQAGTEVIQGYIGWQPYNLTPLPLTWHRAASPPQDKGQARNQLQVLCCLCDHSPGSSTQGPIFTPHTASEWGNAHCGEGNQSTKADEPGPVVGTGGTAHSPPANVTRYVTPCLLCSWQPRTFSGDADPKMKLDKLVPIYLILPESQNPGGEVCCLHMPETANCTKQQVRAELQST